MARQSADALRSGLHAPANAHSTFLSEPGPCRQPRPQVRLAASTPIRIVTYGKKNSKALSLTGNQFKGSDIFTIPREGDGGSEDGQQYAPIELSSREASLVPSHNTRKPDVVPKQAGSKARRQPLARTPALRPSAHQSTVPGQPSQRAIPALSADPAESTESRPKVRKAQRCPEPKRCLPVNELLLLPGLPEDDPPRAPEPPLKAAVRHLKSALDESAVSSDLSDSSEKTTRASLSAIRKRLRTPKPKHKTIEDLQRKYQRSKRLCSMSPQDAFGDGFEILELTISHHSRLKAKRPRRQRQPLWDGMQALSLTTGPLPDVEFPRSDDTGGLSIHHASLETAALRDAHHSPDAGEDFGVQGIDFDSQSCKRSASFQKHVDDFVAAELSSISAPRREYSASIDDDEESEEDDTVESVHEGINQTGECEDEDEIMISDDERPLGAQFRSPSPDGGLSRQFDSGSALHASPPRRSSRKDGVHLDFRRCVTPGYFQASRIGQDQLVEVNEVIDDTPEQDFSKDMLLESPAPFDIGDDIGSDDERDDHQDEAVHYTHATSMAAQPATSMPRSILKNPSSRVQVDTHYSRPESTAANTRRNSTIEPEDSRYFSTAADQLDASPPRRRITRINSHDYRSRSFEVLDSDHVVTETSPEPPDYTNTTQLAALRQPSESLPHSTPMSGRARDLKALTRSVSREYGTLSQSMRRRPSMYFQSPRL